MQIQTVMKRVGDEFDNACRKHPNFARDLKEAATVVAEESGELTQAVNDYHEGSATLEEIRTEALQTAAAAMRFATCMDKLAKEEIDAQEALAKAVQVLRSNGYEAESRNLNHFFGDWGLT